MSKNIFWQKIKSATTRLSQSKYFSALHQADNFYFERFGPIRVLFVATTVQAFSAFMTLIQTMEQDNRVQANLLALGLDNIVFDNYEQSELFKRCRVTAPAAYFLKYHYVFRTNILALPFFRQAIHVAMPHGAAFGVRDYMIKTASQPGINIILGLSEYERKYFDKSCILRDEKCLFFNAGFPKLDPLIQGKYQRDPFLESIGLPKNRQTILIASHFSKNSLLFSADDELIQQVLSLSADYNVIVTGHPMIWQIAAKEDHDTQKCWQNFIKAVKHSASVRAIRAVSELPLLNAADLLIADSSSIVAEFACLDRPILFYDSPLTSFYDADIKVVYQQASESFTRITDIDAKCRTALAEPDKHKAGRRKMVEHFLCRRGASAPYVLELILAMGRMCSSNSSQWKKAIALSYQPNEKQIEREV